MILANKYISILSLVVLSFTIQQDFLSEQKKFARVKSAIQDKQSFLERKLSEERLSLNKVNLIIAAYKAENILEIYARNKEESVYKKVFSYPICYHSGQAGPKLKQGDAQVPEGFYHIDRFNPTSSFYLSLGLNYPNLADKRKNPTDNPGGDIFIHGSCVSIGCMAMTDDFIKEIYLLAIYAKNNGELKIPVYVFPFQMNEQNMNAYKAKYKDKKELLEFWENLRSGYDKFMKDKKDLNIKVSDKGDYIYN